MPMVGILVRVGNPGPRARPWMAAPRTGSNAHQFAEDRLGALEIVAPSRYMWCPMYSGMSMQSACSRWNCTHLNIAPNAAPCRAPDPGGYLLSSTPYEETLEDVISWEYWDAEEQRYGTTFAFHGPNTESLRVVFQCCARLGLMFLMRELTECFPVLYCSLLAVMQAVHRPCGRCWVPIR